MKLYRTHRHRQHSSHCLVAAEKVERSSISSALLKNAAEKSSTYSRIDFFEKNSKSWMKWGMKLCQIKEKLRIETEIAMLAEAEKNLSTGKLAKSGNRLQTVGATDNIRPISRDVIASPSHQHPLLEGATDNIRPSSKGVTQMPSLHWQQLDGATTDIHSPSRHIATSSSLPCSPPEGATSHFYPSVESVTAPCQHPHPPLGGTTAD